jgi:hypothetical protein
MAPVGQAITPEDGPRSNVADRQSKAWIKTEGRPTHPENLMRQQVNYKGYIVTQSILDRAWYADPILALTTERRLKAATAQELKALIDDATAAQRLDPWELPAVGQGSIAA